MKLHHHGAALAAGMGFVVRPARAAWVLSIALGLNACGGGGGGDAGQPPAGTAQVCAPTNPYQSDAAAVTQVGTLATEKAWVQSYMSGAYLWYSEMPAVDASLPVYSDTANVYDSLDKYFRALKTPALTASGKKRDQFSFTYPTKAWQDRSQSGVESGYGIQWYMPSPTPPRGLRIAFVEPGSPANLAGLLRGDVLVSVDGVAADDGTATGVNVLNAALFPSASGSVHSWVFSRSGTTLPAVPLASATVTKHPVPFAADPQVFTVGSRKIGYLLFNDHLGTAEADLITAFKALQTKGANELVLDMRYNGGGYLYVASELAYMIAGAGPTANQVFEQLQYNDKRVADTNSTSARTPFYNTSCLYDINFKCTKQEPLPTLNLGRVVVLTSADTCSASEAVVNGLRGVNVDVKLIGGATCGKPYGFTAKDNCGISYFPIEFKGVNAKAFGDYADGFPADCPASDDFNHALGDPAENQLAAGLYYLGQGSCNPAASMAKPQSLRAAGSVGRLLRGPEREARLLTRGER